MFKLMTPQFIKAISFLILFRNIFIKGTLKMNEQLEESDMLEVLLELVYYPEMNTD